jgi:hypothetical protein
VGDTPVLHLPYPEATEVADVPTDMMQLATKVETELGKKLDSASTAWQRKITIATSLPPTGAEGDIVFLIP